ncbi:MAG: hypothetical protein ACRCU6_06015 [Fusobacteriaceae bacterium]
MAKRKKEEKDLTRDEACILIYKEMRKEVEQSTDKLLKSKQFILNKIKALPMSIKKKWVIPYLDQIGLDDVTKVVNEGELIVKKESNLSQSDRKMVITLLLTIHARYEKLLENKNNKTKLVPVK